MHDAVKSNKSNFALHVWEVLFPNLGPKTETQTNAFNSSSQILSQYSKTGHGVLSASLPLVFISIP